MPDPVVAAEKAAGQGSADPAPTDVEGDTTNAVPLDDGLADLGVLLVHGIGEHAQAETLSQGTEPLIDWLRAWLGRDASAGTIVAAKPMTTTLRPPLLERGVPAHSEIFVGRLQDDQALDQRWLFAEAWWGQQVLTPSIPEFTVWLLSRGPWVMLFHLDQWLLVPRRRWIQVLAWPPMVLMWMLLSLAMNTLLLAAALVALIPFGPLRGVVLTVLRGLAGVLGDAYVLIRHPLQRSAFEEATLQAMAWLQTRCRRLAVVAHSQGAAVAHGALQRPDAPTPHLLVTFGAGITKLHALRWFEARSAGERALALLAPPLLLAGLVIGLRARQLNLADAASAWFGPGALVIAGAIMSWLAWTLVRSAALRLRAAGPSLAIDGGPGFEWHDISSTHDPVPLGTLGRYFGAVPALHEHMLPVLRSWWSDHTHYWQAKASFVPEVLRHLTHCAGAAFVDLDAAQARLSHSRDRRDFDLRVLRGIRWLDLAALATPLLLAWPRLAADVARLRSRLGGPGGGANAPLRFVDTSLGQVEDALQWIGALFSGSPQASWAAPTVNGLSAAALLAAALLLWQRLAFLLWEVWADNRTDEALKPPTSPATAPSRSALRELLIGAAVSTLIDAGLAATLVLPFALAMVWTLGPQDWVGEAQAYGLLGQVVVVLVIMAMIVAWASDVAGTWDEWRDPWEQAWLQHATLPLGRRLLVCAKAVGDLWLARQRR